MASLASDRQTGVGGAEAIASHLAAARPDIFAGLRVVDQVHAGLNSLVLRAKARAMPFPLAIKRLRGSRALDEAGCLAQARARLAGGRFSVPELLHVDEERQLLVMEWIPAPCLRAQMFNLGLAPLLDRIADAAAWLAYFHSASAATRPLDTARWLPLLDDTFKRPACFPHDCIPAAWTLLRQTAPLLEGRPITLGFVHGDFKPENIIVTEARVIGLDISSQRSGPVLVDIVQFINHMLLLTYLPRGAKLLRHRHAMAESFLASYQVTAGQDLDSAALAWFRLHHLLRLWGREYADAGSRVKQLYLSLAAMREITRAAGELRAALIAVGHSPPQM